MKHQKTLKKAMKQRPTSNQFKYIMLKKCILLVLFNNCPLVFSQLKVSKLFNDHMVLQQGHEIPIWGWAEKNQGVSVVFKDETFNTRANKMGQWQVTLPKSMAGGPYELRINTPTDEQLISDIMVGDVWLCSGQSNMEWPVRLTNQGEKAIANAKDHGIRHFNVPQSYAKSPEDDLAGGNWQLANPENTGDFTAVGYYFAEALRKNGSHTIGLLNTTWGGSRIEPWMPVETLETSEQDIYELFRVSEEAKSAMERKLKLNFGQMNDKDKGMEGNLPLWTKKLDDSQHWVTMTVPGLWEEMGYEGVNGVAWYKKNFTLSAKELGDGATLRLSKVDDSDMVWVNGYKVGGIENAWTVVREYFIEPQFLKEGENTITVRVQDNGGGGGIYGDEDQVHIKTKSNTINLSGDWQFRFSAIFGVGGLAINQLPTLLYNKMIHPLLRFPIKGVLWYQGESNAANYEDANAYNALFKTMIEDWRAKWQSRDFPFLWVQLASFMKEDEVPRNHPWAVLRESQTAALELDNTAQVITMDIGDADDIHPRNKKDVGHRMAKAAQKIAYKAQVVHSGPTYASHGTNGKFVTVTFDNLGSGLMTKDKYQYVKGFAVAGADGVFKWAKARIEGNTVIVWNNTVQDPKAMQYGWGANPGEVSLFNMEGFPAVPFRINEQKF